MQVIYPGCCGLDVHKKLIVACLVSTTAAGERQKETRSFTTMTNAILALGEWLTSAGCTQVAMESTGVFWQPIWNLLEGQFEVLLVHAQHIKATTTDSPQWKHSRLDSRRRGDRSDPCFVRPAIALA